MAIGIDEIDYDDNEYGTSEVNDIQTQDNEDLYIDRDVQDSINDTDYDDQPSDFTDSDIISELLKSKGIEDRTRIKFENESGEIEEQNWDDLTNEDKLNIISSQETIEDDFDDQEIQLINAIRSSQMTPAEYLNYVQQTGINMYLQNAQQPVYNVDQFSDDELYVFDLMQKIGEENISEDEALQELQNAKANKELFDKKIGAIRAEYKRLEDDKAYREQAQAQAKAQENFNQFAGQIANQIDNFNGFAGLALELDQDDKEELFDFITGMDEAGTSVLGKAFNDPSVLVPAAWFVLNGPKVFDEINEYFANEIKTVSRESYKKGVEDARAGKVKTNKTQVVSKPKKNNKPASSIDDIW